MLVRLATIGAILFLGGCTYHVAQQTDDMVADLARRSFDPEPQKPLNASTSPDKSKDKEPAAVDKDIRTASFLNGGAPPADKVNLDVPPAIPGSEVPKITAKNKEEIPKLADTLYQPLPPLPEEAKYTARAEGPYTLSELQKIAAFNSPTLRQAASDVKAAEGALITAGAYANPSLAYTWQPSNDGSTAGVQGLQISQTISVAGKRDLAVAAAKKSLENARLALKRARSDLATQVRNAYFGLLVAKETVRVNRALANLTDEVYLTQVKLLKAGTAASFEPATLRGQAYIARLALQNAITSYDFAWMQVVSAMGLRQLPFSEVAGRVDAYIPYFDYDQVLAHVMTSHTDLLTARNGIEVARYNLKLAQIAGASDVNFQVLVSKETSLPPFQWVGQGQVGITLPIWDQNKGNIISMEAALKRASEQPHASELTLSLNLQNAFNNYKNALDGLEFYRRFILPDQVRAYRGVLDRRQIDGNVQFTDLVQAQQTLASNVSSYLTILSQLWTASISVADFLQVDDVFELANPKAVPALPDLSPLAPLPCCHQPVADAAAGVCQPALGPAPAPDGWTKP